MSRPETTQLLDILLGRPSDRQRLITSYVRDEMDTDMLIAFEYRIMDDTQLLDDVQTESALREAMRALPRDAAPTYRSQTAKRPSSIRSILTLAAGLLVGAVLPGIGWWHADSRRAFESIADSAMGSSADVVALVASRGNADPAQVVEITVRSALLILRLPAPNIAEHSFLVQVAFDRFDGPRPFSPIKAVVSPESGYLDVAVPTRNIISKTLFISVLKAEHSEPAGRFVVRLTRNQNSSLSDKP